jgi:hypothetical protein
VQCQLGRKERLNAEYPARGKGIVFACEVFESRLRLRRLSGWFDVVKRDLILYLAYCIGFLLIGLLIASGWRDFFAASHASMGNHATHSVR